MQSRRTVRNTAYSSRQTSFPILSLKRSFKWITKSASRPRYCPRSKHLCRASLKQQRNRFIRAILNILLVYLTKLRTTHLNCWGSISCWTISLVFIWSRWIQIHAWTRRACCYRDWFHKCSIRLSSLLSIQSSKPLSSSITWATSWTWLRWSFSLSMRNLCLKYSRLNQRISRKSHDLNTKK